MSEKPFEVLIKLYPGDTCILCGRQSDGVGLFEPDNSIEWGGYEKKQRYIRYPLCRFCAKIPGYGALVEEKLSPVFKMGVLTQ